MQPGAKTVLQHLQQFVNHINNSNIDGDEDDNDDNPDDGNDIVDDEEELTQPHVFLTIVVSDREKISSTSMVQDDGIVGVTSDCVNDDGARMTTTNAETSSTAIPAEVHSILSCNTLKHTLPHALITLYSHLHPHPQTLHRDEVILCCLDSPSVYRTGGGSRSMQGVTSHGMGERIGVSMGESEVIYGGVKAFTLTLSENGATTSTAAVTGVRASLNHPIQGSSSLITRPVSSTPAVITIPVGLPMTTSSVVDIEQMVQEVLRGCVERQGGQNKGSENQTKKEKRRKKKEKKALAERAAGGGDEGDVDVAAAASAGGGGGGSSSSSGGVDIAVTDADDGGGGAGGEDGEGESKVHKRLREADDGTTTGDVATTRRQSKKSKRTHHSTSETGYLALLTLSYFYPNGILTPFPRYLNSLPIVLIISKFTLSLLCFHQSFCPAQSQGLRLVRSKPVSNRSSKLFVVVSKVCICR